MEKKNNSTKLTLVAACIAVLLSISAIVGGTFALFTGEASVSNNVLKAGSLGVKLERTSLQSTYLDNTGILIEGQDVADSPYKDFTKSEENVFGLTDTDVIVPCSSYTATMLITNTGSVAFDFTASLQITDNDQNVKLSEQVTLKLLDMNGNELSNGTVYAGTNNTLAFKVVLTFNDLTTNNSVMNAGAKVNLLISCTQKTGL
ncbi:MAG: hypothetical protein IKA85_06125 [Clostridia bacterium]|nr:hypothetical protein [Clostridia bacterium]